MKPKKKAVKKASAPAPAEPARWDVVIYKMDTRKVESVVGTDLRETGSFHTVDKRIETAMARINLDHYSVSKVPPGKYQLGSVLDEADIL